MTRKPEGHDEMTELLGKLVKVPKAELDREVEKAKANPKRKKSAAKRKKKS